MHIRPTALNAALVFALAALAGNTQAESKIWNSASGYWDNLNKWSPAGAPTAADSVFVGPVGGVDTILRIDPWSATYLGGDAVASSIVIDSYSAATVSINQTGSTLRAQSESIGSLGTGTYNQSGGTNAISGELRLGEYSGYSGDFSNGTYNLSGGSLTAGSVVIGLHDSYPIATGPGATGTFNQTGGTHVVSGTVTLGANRMSAGTYNLSAGTFASNALAVGGAGGASFSQSGGGNSVASDLKIGGNGLVGPFSSTLGTYDLSGGTLTAFNESIGWTSSSGGVFNQSGGDHTVTGTLTLGTLLSHGQGTFNLSSGKLTSNAMVMGGFAVFTQSGGTHTVTHDLTFIDDFWAGAFDPLGGPATVGPHNVYTLSGGTLSVGGNINVAPSSSGGIFSASGGGVFNLDGGTLVVGGGTGNIRVNDLNLGSTVASAGSHTQTGGVVQVDGNLTIGAAAGANGTYTMAGGVLNVLGMLRGGVGASTLNLDGGTLTAGNGAVAVTRLNLGSTAGRAFTLAIADVAGANTFSSLSADYETIGGAGAGHLIQTGGSNIVGTLTINDRYTYSGGALTVNTALTNNGVLEMGGTTLFGNGSMRNAGLFSGHGTVAGTGAFTNENLVSQGGGHLVLANAGGALNNGNWDMLSGYQLRLDGTTFTNAGTLDLNGGTVSGTGFLSNAVGGTVGGRGLISTKFSNAGTLALVAGTTTISNPFENSGVVQLSGNTANLAGGALTNTGRIEGYGKVANDVSNYGSIEASGGTLILTNAPQNFGNLVAGTGGKLLFQNGLSSNHGNLRLNGGVLDNSGFTVKNVGQIQAGPGTSQIYGGVTSVGGSRIIVSGGGSLSFYDAVDIQSGAELRVSANSVAVFFGPVYQRTGALFTGTGTKLYEGGLSVGGSPGLGIDAGSVSFGDGNLYLAEIGGLAAGAEFDQYRVGGTLHFGGVLKLASWNGFVAQAGQSFDLFDWGSSTGAFGSIDVSGLLLANGTRLDTSHLYSDGVVSVQAVPEPETYAFMLAGLSLLGLARRRSGGPVA